MLSCQRYSNHEISQAKDADIQEVLNYLNDLIENDKSNYLTYYKRSEVYLKDNQLKKSLNDIQRCIELNPTFKEGYYLQSRIYSVLGDAKNSIQSALQAEQRGLRNYALYELIAKNYLKKGEPDNAQKAIQRLLDFNYSAENITLKGDINLQLKDTVEAIRSYQLAIREDSAIAKAYMALINIYQKNNPAIANQYIDTYLNFDSTSSTLLWMKSEYFLGQRLYDSALLFASKANYLSFNDIEVYNKVVESLYHNQLYDSAIKIAKRSIAIDSIKNRKAILYTARSLDKNQRYNVALNYYESLVSSDTTDVIALNELSLLKRKIAYLWQIEGQRKQRQQIERQGPPLVERKEVKE